MASAIVCFTHLAIEKLDPLLDDEARYLRLADNLSFSGALGEPLGTASWDRQPGYPIFLSLSRRLLGTGKEPLAIQVVLVVFAAGLLARAAHDLGGLFAGVGAGLLLAGYLHLAVLAGRFLSEALAASTLIGALFLVDRAVRCADLRVRLTRPLAAGALFGISALTRPIALPLGGVAALVLVVGRRGGRAAGVWAGAVLLAGQAAVIVPWMVRNSRLERPGPIVGFERRVAAASADRIRQGMTLDEARQSIWHGAISEERTPESRWQETPPVLSWHYLRDSLQRLAILLNLHPATGRPFPLAGPRLKLPEPLVLWSYVWPPLLFAGLGLFVPWLAGARRDIERPGGRDAGSSGATLAAAVWFVVPLANLLLYASIHAIPRYQVVPFSAWCVPAAIGWSRAIAAVGARFGWVAPDGPA